MNGQPAEAGILTRRSQPNALISTKQAESPALNNSNDSRCSVEERKARKREQDRLCQRRKREKDRENLRKLEARLDGLQNSDEPKVVLDLILRHEEDQGKIERQAERLRQIEALLKAGLNELEGNQGTSNASDVRNNLGGRSGSTSSHDTVFSSSNLLPGSQMPVNGTRSIKGPEEDISFSAPNLPTQTITSGPEPLPVQSIEAMHGVAMFPNAMSTGMEMMTAMSNPDPLAYPAAMVGLGYSAWPTQQTFQQENRNIPTPDERLVQDTCIRARSLNPNQVVDADLFDQHVLISIAVHGWAHANAAFKLDPIWQCMEQLDKAALGVWPVIDRLVGMMCIRRMMKAQLQGAQATAQLFPKFLRPRPSQINVPHRPDIDLFPWPGLRERLVFDSHKFYRGGTFIQDFSRHCRFLWPYDLSATYVRNKATQMIEFSPTLMDHFNNLNCWTIDANFMTLYPELSGDIPVSNSVPSSLPDPMSLKMAAMGQYYYFGTDQDYADDGTTTMAVAQRNMWNPHGAGAFTGLAAG